MARLYNQSINIIISFISKDFLNADANCPGYVMTAFEMIEVLKNQGAEGKMNQSQLQDIHGAAEPLKSNVQCKNQKIGYMKCVILILNSLNNFKENGQELKGRNAHQILKMKGLHLLLHSSWKYEMLVLVRGLGNR